jgi:hypothetical protein
VTIIHCGVGCKQPATKAVVRQKWIANMKYQLLLVLVMYVQTTHMATAA